MKLTMEQIDDWLVNHKIQSSNEAKLAVLTQQIEIREREISELIRLRNGLVSNTTTSA